MIMSKELSSESEQENIDQFKNSSLFVVKLLYFTYFMAFSIYVTYVNVYFLSIGLSGFEIGVINTVSPLLSMLGSPFWGLLSDRFGNVRRILVVAVLGAIFTTFGLFSTQIFFVIVLLAGGYSLFTSSINPILDSSTLLLLGNERNKYGHQRIWGSIGFIVATIVSGQIFSRIGLHAMFVGILGLFIIFLVILFWFPARKTSLKTPVFAGLTKLLKNPEWIGFMFSILASGIANSGMHIFVGILIKGISGSDSLVGLSAGTGVLSEIPIMLLSPVLITRFHPRKLLGVSFILFTVRLFLYSIMPSPAWVVPLSLFHGVSFGLYWISSVSYANKIAPDSLKGSTQGILMATLSLSSVLSGLISGWIYDLLGITTLFQIYSLFGLFALIILWGSRKYVRITQN